MTPSKERLLALTAVVILGILLLFDAEGSFGKATELRVLSPSKAGERQPSLPEKKHSIESDGVLGYYSSPEVTKKAAEKARARVNGLTIEERRDNPLVAVCLVGAARTLPIPRVYKSIRENLTLALSRNTYIFAHIKLWDCGVKKQPFHGYFRPINVSEDDITEAIRTLDPVSLIVEKERIEYLNPSCPLTLEYAKKSKQWGYMTGKEADRLVGNIGPTADCYRAVEAFEREAGIQFDAVAKARPDAVWFLPSPTAREMIDRDAFTYLFDIFMFSPRKYADGFALQYERYRDRCNSTWTGGYFPEAAYSQGFKEAGATVPDHYRKLPVAIRRFSKDESSAEWQCHKTHALPPKKCLEIVYG